MKGEGELESIKSGNISKIRNVSDLQICSLQNWVG